MSKRIPLQILSWNWLSAYIQNQPLTIHKHIDRMRGQIKPTTNPFSYIVASSVFSSQIEGSTIDVNDYYRYQDMDLKRSKEVLIVDDLIEAYRYARTSPITEKGLLTTHRLLSSNLLSDNPDQQGKYRSREVFIRNTTNGEAVYQGAAASIVSREMQRLMEDIVALVEHDLTHNEMFYFAAQIHLRMTEIHPFADGNGRMARLLEKWFLAQKLGEVAWYIQTERSYKKRLLTYYKRIHMGQTYDTLRDELSVPFLLMLPWSLRTKAT